MKFLIQPINGYMAPVDKVFSAPSPAVKDQLCRLNCLCYGIRLYFCLPITGITWHWGDYIFKVLPQEKKTKDKHKSKQHKGDRYLESIIAQNILALYETHFGVPMAGAALNSQSLCKCIDYCLPSWSFIECNCDGGSRIFYLGRRGFEDLGMQRKAKAITSLHS